MNDNDALAYVSQHVVFKEEQIPVVCPIDDYPQYKYIDVRDENGNPTGGLAYVIALEDDNKLYQVPNNMPPHFNLRSVEDDDAIQLDINVTP